MWMEATENQLLKHHLRICLKSQKKVKRTRIPYEDIRGRGGIAPLFLTSVPDEGEWSASRPCQGEHPVPT
jgi:hypothetical protein